MKNITSIANLIKKKVTQSFYRQVQPKALSILTKWYDDVDIDELEALTPNKFKNEVIDLLNFLKDENHIEYMIVAICLGFEKGNYDEYIKDEYDNIDEDDE